MGRTRWKVASEKKLPIRKRSLEEGMKDWQAVVRKAFATRVCPNCHGALDFFEVGEVSGLRCRECGWGFEHVCDSLSDTCHYEFSVPTKVKHSAS